MRFGRLAFLVALTAMLAVYLAMLFWSLPHLRAMAGGLIAFDLRPTGYTPEEARALLRALGPDGAAFYLTVQHRLDLVYPPLLAVVLAASYFALARRPMAFALSGLAVIATVLDWMENAAVARLLLAGPEAVSDSMIRNASRFSALKSAGVTLCLCALLALVLRAAWRRWRGTPTGS